MSKHPTLTIHLDAPTIDRLRAVSDTVGETQRKIANRAIVTECNRLLEQGGPDVQNAVAALERVHR